LTFTSDLFNIIWIYVALF